MDPTTAIAANQALTQQAVALSVTKSAAQADQQLANIIAQAAANTNVAPSAVRGTNVNFSV